MKRTTFRELERRGYERGRKVKFKRDYRQGMQDFEGGIRNNKDVP